MGSDIDSGPRRMGRLYAFRHGYTRRHRRYGEQMGRARREWVAVSVFVLMTLAGIGATQLPGPAAVVPSAVLVTCTAGIALGWTRTWGALVAATALGSEMSVVASIISFRAPGGAGGPSPSPGREPGRRPVRLLRLAGERGTATSGKSRADIMINVATRVLIADDQDDVRGAFRLILNAQVVRAAMAAD
ncbi:MAG: hypothetical protein ACRDQU_01435 [Pseudonocardiaceae bacterium]